MNAQIAVSPSKGKPVITSPLPTGRTLRSSRISMPCMQTMPYLRVNRYSHTRRAWSRSLSPAPGPETPDEVSVTSFHHKDSPPFGDSFIMGNTNTPCQVTSASREASAPVGDRSDHAGLHLHGAMSNPIPKPPAILDRRATLQQAKRTNQASKGFSGEWRYRGILDTDEAIKHLKAVYEEQFAQMKSNFEARILDVEQCVITDRQFQTNMASRLRTIEENGAEHVKMISNIRNRMSVIEGSIDGFSLSDIHKLIDQRTAKQEEESRSMIADLENRLHDLEETITQISASRVEQEKDVMELKDALEGRIAGIEDHMDTLCVTHSSEITNMHFILKGMEARFCEDGSTPAKPDMHSLSHRTKLSSRALPEHVGDNCAAALRLAVRALSDAVDIAAPLKAIPCLSEHAPMCVAEDQSAALPMENKPADVQYGIVSETNAPLDHNLLSRTCYPINE